jgi:hypothetical protein
MISLFVVVILLYIGDVILYFHTPYEIRAGHWWSWLPMSGYYSFYLYMKG